MELGWIDFSKTERSKILSVLDLLSESGTFWCRYSIGKSVDVRNFKKNAGTVNVSKGIGSCYGG